MTSYKRMKSLSSAVYELEYACVCNVLCLSFYINYSEISFSA